MGEGYGCSNFQCSTLASAIKFIHSCRRAAIVAFFFTSDKEAFLYIRLRITPQYSIDRSQRRKDYCTQRLGHHACFTCEVNGFVQIPYMACCTHVACTSSYSFLMLVQYNMP